MQRPLALSIAAALERVIDTLLLVRRKHSGGLTLGDLSSRHRVYRSRRTQHGVLLDELLAVVYVELTTTRQAASGRGPSHCRRGCCAWVTRQRPDRDPDVI